MKRLAVGLIPILVLLASVFVGVESAQFIFLVGADSAVSIQFADSGVTVFSPVNATYSYKNLVLNVSLHNAGVLGTVDPLVSMNYSVDGAYNGSVSLKNSGVLHISTDAVGAVDLPELPEGSHRLVIYLYGLNPTAYEPKYLSFINTVYFSTEGTPNSTPLVPELLLTVDVASPVNQTYKEASVDLVINVNKATSWMGYSLDLRDNVTLAGNATISGLANGVHIVTVFANDTFGNMGASETVSFTVDVPEPSSSLPFVAAVIVASAAIIITVAGLLVYYRKRKPKESAA